MYNRSMITRSAITLISFVMLLPSPSNAMSPLEKHEALASKLVNQCANINENDLVWIQGSVRDADLLDELALQVQKVGATPLVTIDSAQRRRRYYDVVPERYDTKNPELYAQLLDTVTAIILISLDETEELFSDVSTKRYTTVNEKIMSLFNKVDERNIRIVNLGNGLYPTKTLADQFGMKTNELTKMFWKGVNIDYQKLSKVGKSIETLLANGKKMHISCKRGTDLTVGVAGRGIRISDGVISDEDMKENASAVWLPAGEVYLTPIPGTAEGKVVVERIFHMGKEIENLTLDFKAGKLVSMSAKSGLEPYKAMYDAASEGKDMFSWIDIGINSNIQTNPKNKLVSFVASGTITVGHGGNSWAGGDNDSLYESVYHLSDATLKIDGKTVVDNGVLKY